MSVLFGEFFSHYLSDNLISCLDPKSKQGFEEKFRLLWEFLSKAAKPNLESVAGWCIWRHCDLKELKDQMNAPEEFNPVINDYKLPDEKWSRAQELNEYEKLWTYGGHKKLHFAQSMGSCWSTQRRHRGLQQN